MRHLVATTVMALVLAAAGNALAADATRVIYDLSSLRASPAATSTPRATHEIQLPSSSLPLASPSLGTRGLTEDPMGVGNLDLARRTHGNGWIGTAAGAPRGGRGRDLGLSGTDPQRAPSPNPEPGTMLLLGGALASGIRFLRRS
jgi:hypothetical protein